MAIIAGMWQIVRWKPNCCGSACFYCHFVSLVLLARNVQDVWRKIYIIHNKILTL